MHELIIHILIIAGCEIAAVLLFWLLAKLNSKNYNNKISLGSVFKGIAERAFICFALINGITQSLTLFAALKIATRIKDDDKISNDYYLLGNLLSITLAIIYSQVLV